MESASLLIVGGGILGHVVALRAAEADPTATIILIDRDGPACGASARSVGLHFPLGYRDRVRAASSASQQFYEDLAAAWPDAPIVPLGLRVHCNPAREAWLSDLFSLNARLTREEGQPGVWTAQGAHRADVPALTRLIRRRLVGRVRFLDGLRVQRIAEAADGVVAICADGSAVRAARAVLAPGPWALDAAFRPFTKDLGIRIKRVAALHVDAPAAAALTVDLFIEDDAFLMPRADASHLFSFTRLEWDVDPDAIGHGLDAQDREEALAVLVRHAPHLVDQIAGGQVFCDAYGPQQEPIVTHVGREGCLVFAGAANGSGYRLAPAMAEEALGLLAFAPNPAATRHPLLLAEIARPTAAGTGGGRDRASHDAQ